MKNAGIKAIAVGLLLVGLVMDGVPLHAQINNWTNSGAGKWEAGANWSLGTPPSINDTYDNLFAGSTVTIDATTSGIFTNAMLVNYVALGWPVTLDLNNAGTNVPLHILHNLDISYSSVPEVIVTNSALQVDGVMTAGVLPGNAGDLELDSGWAKFGNIILGNYGNGDLFVKGGTLTISGTLTLGMFSFSGGSVVMSGGTIIHTNNSIVLGSQGSGVFDLSGGSVQTLGFQIGNSAGSQGTLDVIGGTVSVSSNVLVGNIIVTNPCSVSISTNGILTVTNGAHTAFVDISGEGNTLTLNGGLLQVDNLILTNGGSFIDNSGALQFTKAFQVENGTSVNITGGAITTSSNFTLAVSLNSTGALSIANGGLLNITNATLGIGDNGTTNNGAGVGSVTVSNGTLNATAAILGSTAGGVGRLMVQSNALVNVQSNLTVVSGSLTVTSTITLDGGSLVVSNGMTQIGAIGNGVMTISGGNHTFRQIRLGSTNGLGSGGFHFTGGYVSLLGTGTGPGQGFVSNWILWEGGDLDGRGTSLTIADGNDSSVTIPAIAFNVLGQLDSMYVGYTAGNVGTFTQASGSSVIIVNDEMILGDCTLGAVGNVTLSGGTLYVTNATHTANLDVRNGLFTLGTGATLMVDNLILTNACGHFIKQPGAIIITNNAIQLTPGFDADGNGMSNANKIAAGLDLLDPTSVFAVSGVTISNRDVWISWTTEGGHSYVVQTNGTLNGVFQDLPPAVVVPGAGPGMTNYVHTNGVTGGSRFYRMRLGP